MTETDSEIEDGDRHRPTGPELADHASEPSYVLIVGRSRINRVVVSRIVERSGMRPLSEAPETAARILNTLAPAVVILDGGPDNRDCEKLIVPLSTMRRATERGTPFVILLSTSKIDDADRIRLEAVDAVVSKPILPELLQPVIDRLVGREPA